MMRSTWLAWVKYHTLRLKARRCTPFGIVLPLESFAPVPVLSMMSGVPSGESPMLPTQSTTCDTLPRLLFTKSKSPVCSYFGKSS